MTDHALDETAVFLVHTLKQVMYGFDRLDAIGETSEPGSPSMAFYLASIYNFVALLFLLDGKGKAMGGSVHEALSRHELESLLQPVVATLDEPLGTTTFGDAIRVFRNTAIVHSTHADADLDRVYDAVDMSDPGNQVLWQELLHRLRGDIGELAVSIARSTGRPVSDFGLNT